MTSRQGVERAESCDDSRRTHRGSAVLTIGFILVSEVVFLGSGYSAQRLFSGLPSYVLTDASEAGLLVLTLITLRVPYPCRFAQLRGLDLPGWLRGAWGETEPPRGRTTSDRLGVGG